MILRLVIALDAFNTDHREIIPQACERTLVQEAGEIVRGVGQKLAAPEPDEEIEILALDAREIRSRRGFGESDMRDAERAGIAAEPRKARKQVGIGSTREQRRQEGVLARPREVDLVDFACSRLAIKIGTQAHTRDAGCCLNGEHALCGNLVPVGDGWLRYPNTAGEFGDAANRLYCFA